MNKYLLLLALTFGGFPLSANDVICVDEQEIYSRDEGMTDESLLFHLQSHSHPEQITSITVIDGAITDLSLFAIAEYCPNLQVLQVPSFSITDRGVIAVAKRCPEIRVLQFDESEVRGHLTNQSLFAIAKHCKKLKVLDINYQEMISDEGIVQIAKNCPNLRSLHTDRQVTNVVNDFGAFVVDAITDKSLFALAEKCPQLKEIDLSKNCGFTPQGLKKLAKSCKNLETIYAVETEICPKNAKRVWEINHHLDIYFSKDGLVYHLNKNGKKTSVIKFFG